MIYRKNIDKDARDTYVLTDVQDSSIVDKVIGICPVKSELVAAYEVHGTAAGQACTGAIERLQGTEVSGAGDQVVTGFNLEDTANTAKAGTVVTTSDINIFEAGDRVGFNGTGTSTSCATMLVSVQLRPCD
jgi:hypothetical protein